VRRFASLEIGRSSNIYPIRTAYFQDIDRDHNSALQGDPVTVKAPSLPKED
jgi:hypothetical protein